jgi:Herpesviridae UL52/UL70 DNA primase
MYNSTRFIVTVHSVQIYDNARISAGHHSGFPLVLNFRDSPYTVQGGIQGRIRSWVSLDASHSLLLYNISRNRWCGNVGRQHRSNGIFLVVDRTAGAWWQKCYDVECRGYRSPAMPLPSSLLLDPGPPMVGGGDAVGGENDEWVMGADELAAVQRAEDEYMNTHRQ